EDYGNGHEIISSTRSEAKSHCTSWMLPETEISPSYSCLSRPISVGKSLVNTLVFCHEGSVRVVDATYLGMKLYLCANSPSRSGQAAAKLSYVLRPMSSASAAWASASLNWSPSGPRSTLKLQPEYRKSSPPGASTTPSTEMNSVTTMRPIDFFLFDEVVVWVANF